MATYYYVEMEELVSLRMRNDGLCFPESEDELGFEPETEKKKEMKVGV